MIMGIIEVVEKDISELKFAPYNPRKISEKQMEILKKSIMENGIVDPLVWNRRTGFVVGGNQRLAALIDLEYEKTWVAVIDISPEKEKALNLALNKISGDWDTPKLRELLVELDTGEFDIELTGFTEVEIQGIVEQLSLEGLYSEMELNEKKEPRTVVCPNCGETFEI
jgi:ParB-like chromosome segregation protein Spo0J